MAGIRYTYHPQCRRLQKEGPCHSAWRLQVRRCSGCKHCAGRTTRPSAVTGKACLYGTFEHTRARPRERGAHACPARSATMASYAVYSNARRETRALREQCLSAIAVLAEVVGPEFLA